MPGPEPVLQSLGRDGHRIALTNSRRLAIAEGQVGFRYQDAQPSHWQTRPLPAQALIRRLLPHVLPQGGHKGRDYGQWSPRQRPRRRHRQRVLAGPPAPPAATAAVASHATEAWGPPLGAGQPCPSCGPGLLVVIRLLPRPQRGPP